MAVSCTLYTYHYYLLQAPDEIPIIIKKKKDCIHLGKIIKVNFVVPKDINDPSKTYGVMVSPSMTRFRHKSLLTLFDLSIVDNSPAR